MRIDPLQIPPTVRRQILQMTAVGHPEKPITVVWVLRYWSPIQNQWVTSHRGGIEEITRVFKRVAYGPGAFPCKLVERTVRYDEKKGRTEVTERCLRDNRSSLPEDGNDGVWADSEAAAG
jgi:hypothetical protein